MPRVRAGLLIAVLGSLLVGMATPHAVAGGVTTEVFPGPNAIQNAVTAASAGDTLLIHAGTYNENVVIGATKTNLTLGAFGDGPVIVDAGCGSFTTIDVNAGSVVIDGLRVRGGSYYEVDFNSVPGGTVNRSILRDTCNALYGVNVFGTTNTMQVLSSAATGFADAGIYIGGIQNMSAIVLVTGNYTTGSNRGIIIEDIAAASNVSVTGNTSRMNRAAGEHAMNVGISLQNADGVTVDGNTVRRNADMGIALDSTSNGNVVTNNVVSNHTYDLSNLGTGNCFSGNTYTTSNGSLPSCP